MAKPLPTRERVLELLDYNPDTGEFRWKVDRGVMVKAGDEAGTIVPKGYRTICVDGTLIRAHRLAWLVCTGSWPIGQIDHRNMDRLDNRKTNLREANNSQNQQNKKEANRNNKTGFLGVSRQGNKYQAELSVQGKKFYLGLFNTPEDGSFAYLEAKRTLHPFAA